MATIDIKHYLSVTNDNTIAVVLDYGIDTPEGSVYQEEPIEIQDLVEDFIHEMADEDNQTAINDLYVLANEFERMAGEIRDLAAEREDVRDRDALGISKDDFSYEEAPF